MTSQTGQQIITVHILPKVSKSKGNQAMKFGHVIKYDVRNIFLQKLCRKGDREPSSRPLFFKKKASYKGKANDWDLSFAIFW